MQGLTVGHLDSQSRTTLICFHYRIIRLVYLTRARVPFLTHVGPFLWLDHHRTPLDRAKRGLCFGLNVRHFICLSTYLTITLTRLLPVLMKFLINVIGTKVEWRKRKDVLSPPPRFKMAAKIWIFLTFTVNHFGSMLMKFGFLWYPHKNVFFWGLFNGW